MYCSSRTVSSGSHRYESGQQGMHFLRSDGVSLCFVQAERLSDCRLRLLWSSAGAQDLAEGNAGSRVIVAPVRLPSEGHGAAGKCLRILQATGGRQDLRPNRPPRDLCREIVGRRCFLATVDERLRLVVTLLPVENLRQERR